TAQISAASLAIWNNVAGARSASRGAVRLVDLRDVDAPHRTGSTGCSCNQLRLLLLPGISRAVSLATSSEGLGLVGSATGKKSVNPKMFASCPILFKAADK